jgi:hypothetical protein
VEPATFISVHKIKLLFYPEDGGNWVVHMAPAVQQFHEGCDLEFWDRMPFRPVQIRQRLALPYASIFRVEDM